MPSFSVSCYLSDEEEVNFSNDSKSASCATTTTRSGWVWLMMFFMALFLYWVVYDYQFGNLPTPLTAEQAGRKGFSEEAAMKHAKALSALGPHSVGSDALVQAVKYVFEEATKIKETSNEVDEVDIEVACFKADTGANRLQGGKYFGTTHVYSDLSHVLVRILPKDAPEAEQNAILVTAHIDTVFSAEGAGDDGSNVCVMLELARGVYQSVSGFKNAVIFFFNSGEEEGLNGAHSFMTQHPWRSTIRVVTNLESHGIGGRSTIFQAGPAPFPVENYAAMAKYPSGTILNQDLFTNLVKSSSTDFQVYREIGNLSGMDFAYTDMGAVYHTKNDKLELLKPGSFQQLGENMLPFLLSAAQSDDLPKLKALSLRDDQNSDSDAVVFFDILGEYMVVYPQSFGNIINISVIILTIVTLAASLLMGGSTAAVSFILSVFSTILAWVFSIAFSIAAALIQVQVSSSPVPYIANPWLVFGLFAAPALLGALTGQHLGYLLLQRYLSNAFAEIKHFTTGFETERWLYKASFLPWLLLLILGTYYNIGSSFIPAIWLASPAFAYWSMEATLTTFGSSRALKSETLLAGLTIPIIVTGGLFIRNAFQITANDMQLDNKPGSVPEWQGSVTISIYVAVVICLTLLSLLSYVHRSGAKAFVGLLTSVLFAVSLVTVATAIISDFTEDISRALNVIHVVDTTGEIPTSYVTIYSITPGKLTKEIDQIGDEGFVCGRDKVVDFVTFPVKYGCLSFNGTEVGWYESDIPTIDAYADYIVGNTRVTQVEINTKRSTRWALAINFEEIQDFAFKAGPKEIVPEDDKQSVNGWHIIQFAGGQNSPTNFDLTLTWALSEKKRRQEQEDEQLPLLKLRTDLDDITTKVEKILDKFPSWCSFYGKSTAPHTLSFLSNLPVDFQTSSKASA